MDAHRDHRLLEARIADARHGEQELAGKEARRVHRLRYRRSRRAATAIRPYRGPVRLAKGAGLFQGE